MVEEVVSLIKRTLGRASIVLEEISKVDAKNNEGSRQNHSNADPLPHASLHISDSELERIAAKIDYQNLVRILEAHDERITQREIERARKL